MPTSPSIFAPADPAFAQLQARVAYLIEHARRPHPLGVTAYTPAAFGEGYDALYLRDFTYMAESAPEFVPADHLHAVLDLFVAHISPAGLCPERISNAGEIIYICHGGRPVADSPLFLVKLCAAYAARSDTNADVAWLARIVSALARTLASVPVEPETGLVWIDPASPHTAYGFTDTIAITGRHFYCSLLLLEALDKLAHLANLAGLPTETVRCRAQSDRIRENLHRFWSPTHELYLAGSQDCRQADVWGSAYACAIGAIADAQRQQVAQSLIAQRDRFLLRGQVRHLLTPEYWQRLVVNEPWSAPGQFQNGPYWGTATGWMAETFEMAQPGAGLALLHELAADFEAHGIWECIGPDGYTRVANNLSSACLPYASWKKLSVRG